MDYNWYLLEGSLLNCSYNELMYAELYDKILKLEIDTINIVEILQKQTNIIVEEEQN